MTAPQDPFAAPDQGGSQPQGAPQPGYGQPPGGFGAPPEGGFGAPPAYGSTPYGAAPSDAWQGPPLASWGRRIVGFLFDIVISAVIQGVFTAISADLGRVVGLLIALVYGYMTGTTGQTPGRMVMSVKILREQDGQVLGPVMGIVRGLLHILDALPLLLGYFWPLWDKKNQTFADKIVKSVAIKV